MAAAWPINTNANPVTAAGSASSQAKLSDRTRMLQQRVADAKAQKLSCSEWFCSVGLGALFTLPLLGLTGLTTVPANTTLCVFRFGKLTKVIRTPGLYWLVCNSVLCRGHEC